MSVSVTSQSKPLPDAEEQAACTTGDALALLDENFNPFYITIHGYLLHRFFDRELAEELTAETFYRAARATRRLPEDPTQLRMWLLRVASNLANSHYRNTRLHQLILRQVADHKASVDAALKTGQDSDMGMRCREALKNLPSKYQDVVVLRYFSELSFSDMATILKCRETAVRARLSRAVKMLRERLGE